MPAVKEKSWGFEYGCEGLTKFATAAEKLDVTVETIESYVALGYLWEGVHAGGEHRKGHRVVCTRSLREYIQSTRRG